MKILMVNKFLYLRGGSETYIFELGKELVKRGHEVQYFGMEHVDRCMGNSANLYTGNMDFHDGRLLEHIIYPFKVIYSKEAERKIKGVLDDFEPDVIHVNNFNYQLTPSILLSINAYKKSCKKVVKVIYTAHDAQLLCPNHLMQIPSTGNMCDACLSGKYRECISNKCIHNSSFKSFLGYLEATIWNKREIYDSFDAIVCCSDFMKKKFDAKSFFKNKTIVMHNFVEQLETFSDQKKDYILYFGRLSKEKGVYTLFHAAMELPEINFIFAGEGELNNLFVNAPGNIKYVGYQTKDKLYKLVQEALITVCPSECYDNCPFSVIESMANHTPVLGANIGGIPELIKDNENGMLFISGDKDDLVDKIVTLWNDRDRLHKFSQNISEGDFFTLEKYTDKLITIYQ